LADLIPAYKNIERTKSPNINEITSLTENRMMISNYQLSINSNNDLGNIHSRDIVALPQEDSVQVYSLNN